MKKNTAQNKIHFKKREILIKKEIKKNKKYSFIYVALLLFTILLIIIALVLFFSLTKK